MSLTITQAQKFISEIEMELISGCSIIFCAPGQDWRVLFERPVTYIDALKMAYSELSGTDYNRRTYYQPTWHKDMLETKTLVIDNFAAIPPQSTTEKNVGDVDFGDECPGQIDYLFMCRDSDEMRHSRCLNGSNLYFVEEDVTTYLICRTDAPYRIVENITSRAAYKDISGQHEKMQTYEILKVDKYSYTVKDHTGWKRKINLQFYDMSHAPQAGDRFRLSERYFDRQWEGWSGGHFSFGGLKEGYGRDMTDVSLDESEEIIVILQGENKTYLKRFYG